MFYNVLNDLFVLEQNKSIELKNFLKNINIQELIKNIISDPVLFDKIYSRTYTTQEKTRIHLMSLNEDLYSFLPNKNLFLTIYNKIHNHTTSIHSHTCHKLHYFIYGEAEIQFYKHLNFDDIDLEILQKFLNINDNNKTKKMFEAIESSKFHSLGSIQFYKEFKPLDLLNTIPNFSFNDIFNISCFKSFYAKEDNIYQFIDHIKLSAEKVTSINQHEFFFDQGDIYRYYLKNDFLVDLSFEMYAKDRVFSENHLVDYNQEILIEYKKITKQEFKEMLFNYLFYFN